jgi:hypothetical protein
VLETFYQVVSAVLQFHELGILHRNLRASSILVESLHPVKVVLANFSLSCLSPALEGRSGRDTLYRNLNPTEDHDFETRGPTPVGVHARVLIRV